MSNDVTRLADQIIDSVEARVLRRLGDMAFFNYRFGIVSSIGTDQVNNVTYNTASVYLGGDTNSSGGFRIPSGISLVVGDKVGVVINQSGDRWIDKKF